MNIQALLEGSRNLSIVSDPATLAKNVTLDWAALPNLGIPEGLSPEGPSSEDTSSEDTSLVGEPIRHILLGSPGGVRQTIHLLHILHYAENVLWSPLVPIPNEQLMITPRQGEVMSLLVRNLQ